MFISSTHEMIDCILSLINDISTFLHIQVCQYPLQEVFNKASWSISTIRSRSYSSTNGQHTIAQKSNNPAAVNKSINAIISDLDDSSINATKFSDSYTNSNDNENENHILNGIPIAIKDNICTKSFVTSCSSNILKGILFHSSK